VSAPEETHADIPILLEVEVVTESTNHAPSPMFALHSKRVNVIVEILADFLTKLEMVTTTAVGTTMAAQRMMPMLTSHQTKPECVMPSKEVNATEEVVADSVTEVQEPVVITATIVEDPTVTEYAMHSKRVNAREATHANSHITWMVVMTRKVALDVVRCAMHSKRVNANVEINADSLTNKCSSWCKVF